MVKKFTSTKVVETKFPDLPEEANNFMPPKISKKPEPEITLVKTGPSLLSSKSSKKSNDSNITILPSSSNVPAVHLSPMRTRLLERTVEKVPLEEKKPEKKKKEQEDKEKKPRKKVVVDVKSPPKVFKSPTWYKSPSKKVVKEEDLVFKQLLLKDPKLTERDITKILADHK